MKSPPSLNTQVTEAIFAAEHIPDQNSVAAYQAYRKVSLLEEDLAKIHRPTTLEGQIARRGAVMAAVSAKDYTRAEKLVFDYLAERDTPGSLIKQLKAQYNEFRRLVP